MTDSPTSERRPHLAVAFWVLFAATQAVYLAMLFWTLPKLTTAAGGRPFDMRPTGYDFEEARTYLQALPEGAATLYLGAQHVLDAVYPALYGATLLFAIVALLPRGIGFWRWAIGALGPLTAALDYAENTAVAAMLRAGPQGLTAELVANASRWTALKSMAASVSMTLALVLVLVWIGRWLFRRRTTPVPP